MGIHAIIQARMGSTRLPGKVLKLLNGKTILERVVEKANRIQGVSKVIVATSKNKKDEKIAVYCKKNSILYFRGSENDVLDRFVKAAKKYKSTTVIRLTGDNPFLEPIFAERLLKAHLKNRNDYTFSAGYILGTSCEIFKFKSLEIASKFAKSQTAREHLGVYFHESKDKFKLQLVNALRKNYFPAIRLTIDTPEDFETAQNILWELGNRYKLNEIINLYKTSRKIFTNRQIKQHVPLKIYKKIFGVT